MAGQHFFGAGAVAHVSLAEPICANLSEVLAQAVMDAGLSERIRLHRGGTYVCIEGLQFSTQAESHWYRSMGASVIGMTNMPEARLAREAQMAYASLAAVAAIRLLGAQPPPSIAHTALESAVVTQPANMAPDVLARLAVILA